MARIKEFHDNLRAAWDRVRPEDFTAGRPAYPNYHQTVAALAERYGVPMDRAALAFVILSPTNSLMGNLRGLATCLHAHRHGIGADQFNVSGYGRWKVRAMEALAGRVRPHHIKGPKIVALYDNVMRHDSSDRVCVDGHMLCVVSGRDMAMTEAQAWSRTLGYAAVFRMAEKGIKALAHDVGLPPSAVQAILWVARKREKSVKADEWPGNRPISPEDIRLFPINGSAA